MIKPSFLDIKQAQKRLASFVKKTKLTKSEYFSSQVDSRLFLKWESHQEIKSFKIRGALNKILSLTEEEKSRGLIAASAGNHAQGVAMGAHHLKIKARVVMMESASKIKIESTKKLGAEVILRGKTYDESYKYAQSIKGDAIFIHPFADPQIVAGQGTVGLEILENLPEVDSVVVSVGGGGLLLGISLALKHIKPSIKVYGVTWEGTPDFCRNFNNQSETECLCYQASRNSQLSRNGLTDGIAVKKSSPDIVNFCRDTVDGISCVSEEEISKCIVALKNKENSVAEGSGVAGLAGILKYHKKWDLGDNCCVVVSGANIDETVFLQVFNKWNSK